ncbi:podocalyxin-like protein 2 [Heptranchias perlo]|uniref:podocalyxin-like protein 2 n=1 Tax=Heptranchias perlo TaxID=212740 RepID=UPI0035598564
MDLTQCLLCALGSLCFFLAMAEEVDTDVFTAAPGKDLITVGHLDVASAEVEPDALWKEGQIVGIPVLEPLPVAVDSREESNSSKLELLWNAGVHEEPGSSSDDNSSAALLPLAPLPVPVTSQSGAMDPFALSPQPWVSTGADSSQPGHAEDEMVPAASPDSPGFTGSSSAPAAVSRHGDASGALDAAATSPTVGLDQGGRRNEPGALPASPSASPAAVQAPPSSPPDASTAGAIAPLTTATTGSVSPIGRGSGAGFATPYPDHTTAVPEAGSEMAEPGFIPNDTDGTKPATAREELPETTQQVVCRDWSKLAGKSYVILNMTENTECEVFRSHRGLKLLKMVEEAFSRKLSTPADSWLISLSKPSEDDKHLLMMLASDRGTIPEKEVLEMLGDVKQNLKEIGIHNVTSATGCQGRPSQPRGDYGKLFVVLVIIGSICVVIIASGVVYICWQRRLPKLKNMSHGEELHFVENGCHDNPTLDITLDSTSEMQEKKPSVNGDAIERSGGWNALITKGPKDEPDSFEEDTHL